MRLTAIIAILFCSTVALACKCAPPPPPDPNAPRTGAAEPKFSTDDVVFEGEVSQLTVEGWPKKLARGEKFEHPRVNATFSNIRVYHGPNRSEISVRTGLGGGDCGFDFEQGEKYLVYASTNDSGQLETSICSGTSLLADAGDELRRLCGESNRGSIADARQKTRRTTRICGRVRGSEQRSKNKITVNLLRPRPEPLPFVLAVDTTEAKADGSFCLDGVPPGTYIVEAERGKETSATPEALGFYPNGIRLSEAKPLKVACGSPTPFLEFAIRKRPVVSVEGWVVSNSSQSATQLKIVLLPQSRDNLWLGTDGTQDLDENGTFRFEAVPVGRYSLFVLAVDDDDESATIVSSVMDIELNQDLKGLRFDLN